MSAMGSPKETGGEKSGWAYTLKMTATLLGVLAVLEVVASFSIVGLAFALGKNYTGIARKLFVTDLLISRWLPRSDLERLTDAKDVGFYSVSNAGVIIGPNPMLGWYPNPDIGYGVRLNEEQHVVSEMPDIVKSGAYDQYIFTNGQGFYPSGAFKFRYAPTKPKSVYRVVVLGGSTTIGVPLGHSQNIPAKLSAILNAELKKRGLAGYETIEVINTGVMGYYSTLEYLLLLTRMLDFQPDLVLAYDGWNDVLTLNKIVARSPTKTASLAFETDTHLLNHARLRDSYEVAGSFRHFAGALTSDVLEKVTRTSLGFIGLKLYNYVSYYSTLDQIRGGIVEEHTSIKYDPRSALQFKWNVEREIFLAHQMGFKFAHFLQPLVSVDDKTYFGQEKIYLVDHGIREVPTVPNNREMHASPRKPSGRGSGQG